MTVSELLQIMRLLSALESWGLSIGKPYPDYLHEHLENGLAMIEREIVKATKATQ